MSVQVDIKTAQAQNLVSQVTPDVSHVRLEIDEFSMDEPMLNLYLLALEAMQKEDPTKSGAKEDWWTFYSLAGVHGAPISDNWCGVKKSGWGYCQHGAPVFPTWHRVYMNAYEQAIALKMQAIANQYTDATQKQLYVAAANRFRIPYWDPLVPRNKVNKVNWKPGFMDENIWDLPKIVSVPKVYVHRPTGDDFINNPLYSFRFPDPNVIKQKGRPAIDFKSMGGLTPLRASYTVRSPDKNGETDVASLRLRIQRQNQSMGVNLWKLLAKYGTDMKLEQDNDIRTWNAFASHSATELTSNPPPSLTIMKDGKKVQLPADYTSVSLESWHDNYHNIIGTGVNSAGHMSSPALAAFDPLFWLHHTNIDRILAIFQALYPKKWLSSTGSQTGTSPLIPFRKTAAGGLWDSNGVADWKACGYAVPGPRDLDEAGVRNLQLYLNEHYGWIGAGVYPPDTLMQHWPKDFSKSFALNGKPAQPPTQPQKPTVKFAAMTKTGLVHRALNHLPAPLTSFIHANAPQVPLELSREVKVEDKPKEVVVPPTQDAPKETISADGKTPTWTARVHVLKFFPSINGSFNVHLFIGPVDSAQPERYITRKNEVGFTGVFASSSAAQCANCDVQRVDGFIYEDAIPLTPLLFDYLASNKSPDGPDASLRTLKDFSPGQVGPFLRKNLSWEITDAGSVPITEEAKIKESKLEVTVFCRDYEPPSSEHPLGLYYPSEMHPEATNNKLGGYGYGTPAHA